MERALAAHARLHRLPSDAKRSTLAVAIRQKTVALSAVGPAVDTGGVRAPGRYAHGAVRQVILDL
jgi:hypothetical protein